MKKKFEFVGLDVNLETSLFDYGVIVAKCEEDDDFFCVYRINDQFFGCGYIKEKEINELLTGKDWLKKEDLESFFDYVGVGPDIQGYLLEPIHLKISDLLNYFGSENIFGTDYNPMEENEVKRRYFD